MCIEMLMEVMKEELQTVGVTEKSMKRSSWCSFSPDVNVTGLTQSSHIYSFN